jgi:hypothetical protein
MNAQRISRYRYKLPGSAANFLKENIIITLFTQTDLGHTPSQSNNMFLVLVPMEVWASSLLNQIETLDSTKEENNQFRRIAIGYSEKLILIDNVLDLSKFSTLVEFAELHNCLADDDLDLEITGQVIRLEISCSNKASS